MLSKQAYYSLGLFQSPFGCTRALRRQKNRKCRAASKCSEAVCAALPLCTIPNGLEIAYVSKPDVAFLYREVYEKQSYLQHGVTISPGDTVLDVGANIGIFAAFAAEKVGKSGLVIAVEPVPPTWEVLNYNVDLMHRPGDHQT